MNPSETISDIDRQLLSNNKIEVNLEKDFAIIKHNDRKFSIRVLNNNSQLNLDQDQCAVVAQKVAVMLLKKGILQAAPAADKLKANINSVGIKQIPSNILTPHHDVDNAKNTTEDYNQLIQFILTQPGKPGGGGKGKEKLIEGDSSSEPTPSRHRRQDSASSMGSHSSSSSSNSSSGSSSSRSSSSSSGFKPDDKDLNTNHQKRDLNSPDNSDKTDETSKYGVNDDVSVSDGSDSEYNNDGSDDGDSDTGFMTSNLDRKPHKPNNENGDDSKSHSSSGTPSINDDAAVSDSEDSDGSNNGGGDTISKSPRNPHIPRNDNVNDSESHSSSKTASLNAGDNDFDDNLSDDGDNVNTSGPQRHTNDDNDPNNETSSKHSNGSGGSRSTVTTTISNTKNKPHTGPNPDPNAKVNNWLDKFDNNSQQISDDDQGSVSSEEDWGDFNQISEEDDDRNPRDKSNLNIKPGPISPSADHSHETGPKIFELGDTEYEEDYLGDTNDTVDKFLEDYYDDPLNPNDYFLPEITIEFTEIENHADALSVEENQLSMITHNQDNQLALTKGKRESMTEAEFRALITREIINYILIHHSKILRSLNREQILQLVQFIPGQKVLPGTNQSRQSGTITVTPSDIQNMMCNPNCTGWLLNNVPGLTQHLQSRISLPTLEATLKRSNAFKAQGVFNNTLPYANSSSILRETRLMILSNAEFQRQWFLHNVRMNNASKIPSGSAKKGKGKLKAIENSPAEPLRIIDKTLDFSPPPSFAAKLPAEFYSTTTSDSRTLAYNQLLNHTPISTHQRDTPPNPDPVTPPETIAQQSTSTNSHRRSPSIELTSTSPGNIPAGPYEDFFGFSTLWRNFGELITDHK